MADNIEIQINDRASAQADKISNSFRNLASASDKAGPAISRLKSELGSVGSLGKLSSELAKIIPALNRLDAGMTRAATTAAKLSIANQKLATEQAKTAAASAKAADAANKANASYFKAEAALNSAIASEVRAKSSAAVASVNLANANQRLNITSANLATAEARTSVALNNVAASASRATTAETQTAAAAQRLTTAQAQTTAAIERTATAAQNTAAATSRAEAAALRLAQAQNRVSSSSTEVSTSLGGMVKQLIAIAGAGSAVSNIVKMADAYTVLQNKLQNVSTSQAQVNELTERLFDLANKTRTPVEETATAFTRFDRALKYMGKSQEDTLKMTETINKALVVSGTTATEASSALLQLSQAFNAGKLQGDEFRSISENMPIVLDAVAKAMGKPIAQVKQLSSQGAITADVLYRAFEIMGQQVNDTFGKTIPTLSQSMAVLRNNWMRFIGELNKSTGATAALSQLILTISNNLDTIAVSAASAGVALLVAFGPKLLAALKSATAATLEFTLALARNPIGLIAVALTALISTITIAGDKINAFGSSFLTLKDYAVGTVETISDAFKGLGDTLASYFKPLVDGLGPMFNGAFETIKNDLSELADNTKTEINTIVGLFDNAQENIQNLWSALPTILSNLVKTAANMIVKTVETMINGIASAINGLFSLANKASAAVGGDKLFNTDLKVDLAKYLSDIEPVTQKFGNTAGKDYVGAFFDSVKNNAQKRGVSRLMDDLVSGGGPSNLRGTGPNTAGTTVGKTKKPKKTPLTELQKAQNRILHDLIKTYQGYNLTVQAADSLLAKGAITQEQYNRVVLKAKEEYLNTIDPLRQINKNLDDQQKLIRESSSTRSASTQLQQIENQLLSEGVTLTNQQTDALRNKIQALEDAKVAQSAMDDISSKGTEGLRQLTLQAQGYSQALQNGTISQDQYQRSLNQLGVAAANIRLQMGDGDFTDMLVGSLGQLTSNFDGVMSGLTDTMGTFFDSFTTGFSSAISGAIMGTESFGDAMRDVARNAIGALISSLIQLGIQWAVNAALGQTLQNSSLAATAIASTAAAGTVAAAWAPAAALASLASFGANSAPASAGMLATFGVGETISSASALGGFQSGGYTGNAGVSDVAGVVHGQEYVFDAAATKRIGVNNLEAMRSGSRAPSSSSNGSIGGMGGNINIEFVNNGTPQNYQVEQLDENHMRVIAEDAVSRKAGEAVARDFNNPNSKASKGITNNFDANRKR